MHCRLFLFWDTRSLHQSEVAHVHDCLIILEGLLFIYPIRELTILGSPTACLDILKFWGDHFPIPQVSAHAQIVILLEKTIP